MSRERTFRTALVWETLLGDECEAEVNVTYAFHAGFAGDRIDPPESDSVEITFIAPLSDTMEIPESFFTDDSLMAECMHDYADYCADGAEHRADQLRDDAMMGWLA